MTYESRPSNGVPFLVGALPFALISLLVVCSAVDVLQRAIENTSGPMFMSFLSHGIPLVLFGIAPTGLMGFLFMRSQKKLKEWQAGGGEERMAAQAAAFQAQHAQAAAQQLADLAARGIHLLAPYTPRPANSELDQFIDSVIGPTLRQGEIILDRAYGSRKQGEEHYLVCVTSQRVAFLETTFMGFKPAAKCNSLQIIELAQVTETRANPTPLRTGVGIGFTEQNGKETGILIDTVRMDTGFPDQGGFATRVPTWLQATVAALRNGASLTGPSLGQAAPAPPQSIAYAASPAGAPQQGNGTPINVRYPDGSVHQALVVRTEGEQALCRFVNGSEQWVPRTAIS